MFKHPNHLIGDVWFYAEKDRVHVYYLTCPDTLKPHTEWDIGHATSTDLIRWHVEEPALGRGPKGAWNDCYATGNVVKAGSQYVMSFTSHNRAETGLARSKDLYHWELDSGNPTTQLDTNYYVPNGGGKRQLRHWRDPFLFKDGGRWLQLVCAAAKDRPAHSCGAVGLAESPDLRQWTVLPPLDVECFCEEMECPQLYVRNGRYYLVFSTLKALINPASAEQLRGGPRNSTFVMIADNLMGPYRLAKHPHIIPPESPLQPYACQLVSFRGKDYCMGTVWSETPSYMCDPIPVVFGESGIYADMLPAQCELS